MSGNVGKDEFVFVVESAPVSTAVVEMNTNATAVVAPQIVVDVAPVGTASTDILQQALAEVTSSNNKPPPTATMPVPLVASEDSNDLSFLLNPSATSNSESSILEQLGSIEPTPPTPQIPHATSSTSVSFSANTVKTSMSTKETITLYKGNGSNVLPEVNANQHLQQQHQPKLITSVAGAYAGVNQSTVASAGIPSGVVLVPNTSPNGIVTYMLKPHPANPPLVTFASVTQATNLNARAQQQQHFVPAILAPRATAAAAAAGAQLVTATQLMRPVMATGIASSRPTLAKRPMRQQPLLLPKLPVTPSPASRSGPNIGQPAGLPRIVPRHEISHATIEPLPEKVVVPEGDEDWSAVVVGKGKFPSSSLLSSMYHWRVDV